MSIRRMMLFTLGAKIKNLIQAFKLRVLSSQGEFEAESCLDAQLVELNDANILDSASLVITPNGYKENLLYAVEPSEVGTNLLLYSEDFNNSYWVKVSATILPSQVDNPFLSGKLADKVLFGANALARVERQNVPTILGTQYTYSVWLRADSNMTLNLIMTNTLAVNVTTSWQRFSITVIAATTTTTPQIRNSSATAKDFYMWGAQLVTGSTVTNYISTTDRQIINGTIGDMSVTRATTATRVNADGLIETVPYNLVPYSQDFENASWFKTSGVVTVVQNITTAPDGTLTADQIKSTLGNGELRTASTIGVTTDQQYTWSAYVKSAGSRYCVLTAWNGDDPNTTFDLTNISIVSESGPAHTSTITDVGNGWRRITITRTISTTYNLLWFRFGPNSYAEPNTEGVYLWGAQIVQGAQAKDYFPTTNRFNIPRIDYSNGSCPSILVEPQRTNLLVRSEDFTNGWSLEGTSITSNTQTAPDNLPSADTLSELATNDVHRTYRSAITVTANALYTSSFFVKKNNIRYVRLILTQNGSTTIWAGAQFDLDTQTFTSQVGTGGGVFSTASITSFINGWFRISVVGSIPGIAMIPMLVLSNGSAMLNTDTRGCPIYLGNTSNSVFVWGAQLEVGGNATSYIPTTTAAVTRNADVISNTNASTLIGQTEGTIFVEFVPKVINSDIIRITENIDAYRNGFFIFINTQGNLQYLIRFNNAFAANHTISVNISNTPIYKVAITYSSGNTRIFVNGVLRVTNTNVYTFSLPLYRIVMDNAQWTGINQTRAINNVYLWKTKLTDTQAIQLTTL